MKIPSILLLAALLLPGGAPAQSPKKPQAAAGLLFPPEALIKAQAELGLSDSQTAAIRGAAEAALPEFREKQRVAEERAQALRAALQAEPPDESVARSSLAALLDAERAVKELEFSVLFAARMTLSAEQRTKARALASRAAPATAETSGEAEQRVGAKLQRLQTLIEQLERDGRPPREHEAKVLQLRELVRVRDVAAAEKLIDELLEALGPQKSGANLPPARLDQRHFTRVLAKALAEENLEAVRAAAGAAREALGAAAGEPEVPDEFRPVPTDGRMLTRAEAQRGFAAHFDRMEKMRWWKVGVDPATLSAPLRAPASVITGQVAAFRAQLDGAERGLAMAREAADFLMWAQQEAGSGVFPFPAARGTSEARAMQAATAFLKKAEQAGQLDRVVRRGWAFEDLGDGGLQFDNGECGVAMFELYEVTKDPRHLASARQAADWALARPLCTNWNYNSFSVHLLAKAHAVTGDAKYLTAALHKARLGVIPGQLTDGPQAGRWMDAHNARPAYHYIMLRALTQLAAVLPPTHAERAEILRALSLGLKTRNAEILTRGVMNKDKAMEALLLVSRVFAQDAEILRATQSSDALRAIGVLVSEEARRGRVPLGPGEWGQFLESIAD